MNFQELTKDIQLAHEEGVTLEQAERLAAKFLHAQIQVSEELLHADLDARMRKTGVKAIKAGVYMEGATAAEKKPSDVMLNASVDLNVIVQKEQDALDKSEVERDELERYYNIFKDAHIFFRGVAKGNFSG